ncbi:N-acetylmuramoyl-L-alanine amidase [Sphingomonas sp. Leaf4]|uniref:N-acetylmuramoyl-L-alanine amidase n=1 Tax=Sphingomonas sp. Leaf4 TaxID=2876553 RepID=UPI001E44482A|nr:N-acetylmuramoyl-L-alanine amidase [Sphingomonas sp. Leaf4]
MKTLLERARVLTRAWSVQLAAIGALLSAILAIDPVALQAGWQTMPPELRALIPAHVSTWITAILFAAVIAARAMPQSAVTARLGLLSTAPAPVPAWLTAARAPIARAINGIVIHCSATREGQHFTAADIRAWHLAKKWADIGYHFVIGLDGTIEIGRPLAQPGAHVAGYNARTIGICYVGGCAADGKTIKDTRTPEQKAALVTLLTALKARWPKATIKGHRDYSPDTNGDGRITPGEWIKGCPSFDAAAEYKGL